MAREEMKKGEREEQREPMGKHESGKVKERGDMAMKDLRGLKEFKGACMGDKFPKGKTKG